MAGGGHNEGTTNGKLTWNEGRWLGYTASAAHSPKVHAAAVSESLPSNESFPPPRRRSVVPIGVTRRRGDAGSSIDSRDAPTKRSKNDPAIDDDSTLKESVICNKVPLLFLAPKCADFSSLTVLSIDRRFVNESEGEKTTNSKMWLPFTFAVQTYKDGGHQTHRRQQRNSKSSILMKSEENGTLQR